MVGAGLLVTEVVAAPIGSWLLSKDLWLPFKFSAPIILLSFPVILVIPETLPPRKMSDTSDDGQANRHEPLVQLNSTLVRRLYTPRGLPFPSELTKTSDRANDSPCSHGGCSATLEIPPAA